MDSNYFFAKKEIEQIKASPKVRSLAKKLNVDLTLVTPSGINNRILEEDVEKYYNKVSSFKKEEAPKDEIEAFLEEEEDAAFIFLPKLEITKNEDGKEEDIKEEEIAQGQEEEKEKLLKIIDEKEEILNKKALIEDELAKEKEKLNQELLKEQQKKAEALQREAKSIELLKQQEEESLLQKLKNEEEYNKRLKLTKIKHEEELKQTEKSANEALLLQKEILLKEKEKAVDEVLKKVKENSNNRLGDSVAGVTIGINIDVSPMISLLDGYGGNLDEGLFFSILRAIATSLKEIDAEIYGGKIEVNAPATPWEGLVLNNGESLKLSEFKESFTSISSEVKIRLTDLSQFNIDYFIPRVSKGKLEIGMYRKGTILNVYASIDEEAMRLNEANLFINTLKKFIESPSLMLI